MREYPKVTEEPNIQISGLGENVHNWMKQSILWDLPYWRQQLLRYNLDVMHIEKNFSENMVSTVMGVVGISKDNVKVRLDLDALCAREERHIHTRKNGNPYKPKQSTHCSWNRDDRYVNGFVC